MPTKPEQIVEAMKKLDEKLVSYLSGEEDITGKGKAVYPEYDAADNEYLNNNYQHDDNIMKMMMLTPEQYHENQLNVFESVTGISLNMEALTLEAEGTRRMELLQNDIRPIFTIECQLSHELVKNVPKSEMYHIMQFESEKFQSSSQCARFGQEAFRQVHLSLSNEEDPYDKKFCKQADSNPTLPNLGRIHFIVWWREPGTCLNEMLGMGVLHLNQFYNANLLEQCKCITIKRRNDHLANLYFKISLQVPFNKKESKLLLQGQDEIFNTNNNNSMTMMIMNTSPNGSCTTNEHKHGNKNVFCSACAMKGSVNIQKLLNINHEHMTKMNNNEAEDTEKAFKTGEYEAAARCFYYNPKDTKIQ